MGVDEVVGPHLRAVKRVARAYGAYNLRIFGSVARREASNSSDVDFLVDFRGAPRRSELRGELENLLGRRVDVMTESSLHWFVQPQIVTEAIPL
jgi:uncharacterized protein